MTTTIKQEPKRRRLIGTVVSMKMMKTVSVRVDRTVVHPKYGKRYAVSAKYLAHNESPDIQAGDKVVIEETRPLSALKRWRVVSKA
ncbi:MAG: 30S ribosomal protein S17 [Patescibacteria group bacterium]|jgi:small subunit ribosomal protein S17